MIRILFLEDNADDVELIHYELQEAKVNFTSVRVDKQKKFFREVTQFRPHIILADYSLPKFNGMEAFRMLKRKKLNIPFILVTGALSEQVAMECLKEGVNDFILKSSFKRLPAAIKNAIDKKKAENEKANMALAIQKTNHELQLLTERLQVSREEERLSLARDLHDELGQVLTGLKIDVSMLRKGIISGRMINTEEINAEFKSIIDMIDHVMQQVKRISSGLRSEILDELGIVEAIRWLCQDFESRNKIKCTAYVEMDSLDIDRNFSIALFRIVQEALTNVIRHAKASNVTVQLSIMNEILFLSIQDDGVGISDAEISNSNALGIIGLRERTRFLNGRFAISGKKGKGTKIVVTVPVKQAYVIEQD